MPLLSPTPAPIQPTPQVVNPPNSFTDRPWLDWIDPLGRQWDLHTLTDNANGVTQFAMAGVKGLGAPPLNFTTDTNPRGGARVRHIQPGPRLITLPIYIEGRDHMSMLARWRELAHSFAMTRRLGPGILRATRPDGTSRQIPALYQEGWDVNPDAVQTWDSVVLTLFCPSPYWISVGPISLERTHSVGSDFFVPFPTISAANTLGDAWTINPGDVEAWPTWQITGPLDVLTATNSLTGDSFTLDIAGYRGYPLAAGETVLIGTDPPYVTGPDGTNWIGALNWPGAVLWSVLPGGNDVVFVDTQGEGPGTTVRMQFDARYETA